MIKIAIPVLLSGIIIIAGIFAFMPVDMASTVHDTLVTTSAATTQTTTIQNTQFNNVNSTYDSDLSSNATATCTTGDFLVYYTFTNGTVGDVPGAGTTGSLETQLGIDDPTVGSTSKDIVVTLVLGNQTSISGTVSGTTSETITFFGTTNGSATRISEFEDTGDLVLTVQCQSTATPRLVP